MRYPLISLMRHTCHVALMDGEVTSPDTMSGWLRRRFLSTDEALNYLNFWRHDRGALNDLLWVVQRTGTQPAGPRNGSTDDVLRTLAALLVQQTIVVLESSLQRTPMARLSLPPDTSAAALEALPALDDMPSEPVLPPLLPALEEVQIEGAEVIPEVNQSLEQIDASIKSLDDVSVSLAPTPDKVPQVKESMTKASTNLRTELDKL